MFDHSPSPSLQGPPTRPPRALSSAAISVSDVSHEPRTGGLTPLSITYDDDFRFQTRMQASGWVVGGERSVEDCVGVLLRRTRGSYVTAPAEVHHVLQGAVIRLNLVVALTMRPSMLEGILNSLTPGQTELRFKDGSQLQIIESLTLAQPSTVKKFQYACICRQERLILVWQDDLQNIIPQATRVEERLLSLVWGEARLPFNILQAPTLPATRTPSIMSSAMSSTNFGAATPGLEKGPAMSIMEDKEDFLDKDPSYDRAESLARPVIRTSAFFVGLSLCLGMCLLMGVYPGKLISETLLDGDYTRLALLAPVPILMCISLFFFQVIFSNIFQIIGPIGGTTTNSRFYSCYKPCLRRAFADGFTPPKITIQLPVYKEGMESVIMPTVKSLQAAISYYESHGGTANIFVNDDGLRAGLTEEECQQRRDFYHDNNIGWVARPKHNGEEGFERAGKFKKASNMNFALNISQKVEAHLQDMIDSRMANGEDDMIFETEEEDMYQLALARVLEENPLAWAEGNIRVGELILIIDSDTRVPVDCLLYGAAEMFLSPEVAIVQHNTGVMQVAYDYFENGITFFTNLVYTSIRFSIGSGEVAPFVGHNAFLRWQAVQDVGIPSDNDYTCYWSESHVSEDFDMALRLQIKGSIVRVATYHGEEFKEGVSLTIYDEIARWQKYAYGVSEMIFHPFHRWIFKGPFTPLFYTFLGSNIIWSSKFSILAYMCSYFALGSALLLSILNYFLVGWFRDDLSSCYMTSWNVFLSLVVVFNLLGHVALAFLRYRTGEKSLLGSLFENFKWTPMLTCFFGGIAYHVTTALLCHLFHIDMQWGATSKEKEESNFFQEMPRIFNTFKWMYLVLVLIVGGMVYLGAFAPPDWAITDFTAIVPLAMNVSFHALVPLVLNPSLMVYNY
ncbi:putative glycosyltransferase family 2 protein [Emericellopsis atlantica]|uniref:Glycosyltransferase family 2 protein n=1 Tax=Emericellopsis atlantica TaxID=2614577 RepID=A0A9P7ZNG9_9HYPO|nr:putative glycosyltransferase family 2 protein [Emericellopsis atlantica]KAG9255368.1 putative glycosyltransferase family 2 protein [Emericellopsis atlantica]